jgi:hypothetical protein
MIIKKMAIPRRAMLRGLGAGVALPLLDAMVPALSVVARAATTPTRRLGFVYVPNGANMVTWTPPTTGANFTLSPTLAPLAPFQHQMVVATGLSNREADSQGDGSGEHPRASAGWLTGVHAKRTEGADIQAGTSADQIAARDIGKDSPVPSLEMGLESNYGVGNCNNGYACVYQGTVAWRTPTTPLSPEVNPRVIFERLFGEGGSTSERLARMRKDASILDWVMEDTARLRKSLGASDQHTVNQYLDSVREIERRIQKSEAKAAASTMPTSLQRPVGVPETYDEHARLMYDLQWLAYQVDATRVFTFVMGRENGGQSYPASGVLDQHHGTSHHQGDPIKLEKINKINKYHVSLLAYFLDKLKSTPDGDGTLLDHSMILYGAGLSDGDQHSHLQLPMVVVGGGAGQLQGNRHIEYVKDTPMSNFLLSVLDKVGVKHEKLGDSTARAAL